MAIKTLLLAILLSLSLSSAFAQQKLRTPAEEKELADTLVKVQRDAERGHVRSMIDLGHAYLMGAGGYPQDSARAATWYLKAAELGDAEAQNEVGELYDEGNGFLQDYKKAHYWYEKAAAQGNAWAMYNLGNIYWVGERGFPADVVRARTYFERAAANYNSTAFWALGAIYFHADGVKKDIGKAKDYWERGAKLRCALSARSLGVLYRDGMGVKRDAVTALMWFRMAAKRNLKIAVADRDALEKSLSKEQVERAKGLEAAWVAQLERK